MTDLEAIACQLEALTAIKTTWCVGPDQNSMVTWFDRSSCSNPEGAAHDWLNEAKSYAAYRDYIVYKVEAYSGKDKEIRELAQMLRESPILAVLTSLQRAVFLYENYGLIANPLPNDLMCAGRWANEARDAIKGATKP